MIIAGAYIKHREKPVASWEASCMEALLEMIEQSAKDGYVIEKERRLIHPWHKIENICYRDTSA